jgi:transcriptional regulator CtsR
MRHGMHKLTDGEVRRIRERHAIGANRTDLARQFHVTPRAIDFVVSRRHWKHIA